MLKLTNLTKSIGKQIIFKEVSLFVSSGERVAVLGPSGAGKSTLLRCIAGLDSFEGEVQSNGKIVLIFQDFQLFPHLTVFENITYVPLRVLGYPKQEVFFEAESFLNKFMMADCRDKYPSVLSGGQQQRVSIIRAIMTKPAVLVMDEPTSSLDSETTEVVGSILKSLPITYVFATHDEAFVSDFATKHLSLVDQHLVIESKIN